jgi:hypothetical protein
VLGALCGVIINLLSEVADDSACGVFGHHVRFHENDGRQGLARQVCFHPYSNRALSERHVKRFCGCGRLRRLDKAEAEAEAEISLGPRRKRLMRGPLPCSILKYFLLMKD